MTDEVPTPAPADDADPPKEPGPPFWIEAALAAAGIGPVGLGLVVAGVSIVSGASLLAASLRAAFTILVCGFIGWLAARYFTQTFAQHFLSGPTRDSGASARSWEA